MPMVLKTFELSTGMSAFIIKNFNDKWAANDGIQNDQWLVANLPQWLDNL